MKKVFFCLITICLLVCLTYILMPFLTASSVIHIPANISSLKENKSFKNSFDNILVVSTTKGGVINEKLSVENMDSFLVTEKNIESTTTTIVKDLKVNIENTTPNHNLYGYDMVFNNCLKDQKSFSFNVKNIGEDDVFLKTFSLNLSEFNIFNTVKIYINNEFFKEISPKDLKTLISINTEIGVNENINISFVFDFKDSFTDVEFDYSVKDFIFENINVKVQYLNDFLTKGYLGKYSYFSDFSISDDAILLKDIDVNNFYSYLQNTKGYLKTSLKPVELEVLNFSILNTGEDEIKIIDIPLIVDRTMVSKKGLIKLAEKDKLNILNNEASYLVKNNLASIKLFSNDELIDIYNPLEGEWELLGEKKLKENNTYYELYSYVINFNNLNIKLLEKEKINFKVKFVFKSGFDNLFDPLVDYYSLNIKSINGCPLLVK